MKFFIAAALLILVLTESVRAQSPNPCEQDPKGVECTLCRHSGKCKSTEIQKPRSADHPCARSLWLDRCPARLNDVATTVTDLMRATDACAGIIAEGAKFRESRMGYNFSCERDLPDLQQQLNALDGFDLPPLDGASAGAGHGGKGGKHLEACVDDLIKPLYERIVPEAIRNRPAPAPQSSANPAHGTRPQSTPARPPLVVNDDRQVTPVLFENLNRLLGFKSIDLPMLDIRIREQVSSIDSLRRRLQSFKEDCGE